MCLLSTLKKKVSFSRFDERTILIQKNSSNFFNFGRKLVSIAQIEGNYFIQRFDNFC